jgi:hypothetical protein
MGSVPIYCPSLRSAHHALHQATPPLTTEARRLGGPGEARGYGRSALLSQLSCEEIQVIVVSEETCLTIVAALDDMRR